MRKTLLSALALASISEIDGFAAVVPEISAKEVTLQEAFSSDPLMNGWQIFGETNLFHWDATRQNVQVTWDSSKPNSYLYRPLGTLVDRHDDFSLAFDLRLDDIAAGLTPGKPSTFPLAIGLLNRGDAKGPNFIRGTGSNSPNLVEFNFFPDTGFGPTVWPAIWSTNSTLTYHGANDYSILDLPLGVVLRITMSYTASNSTLVTTIATNGVSAAPINPVTLSRNFTNFRVDSFAVESYSDGGQETKSSGSLLAHGVVDNLVITMPPPPVQNLRGALVNGQWQATFLSRTNWNYMMEATQDFSAWSDVSPSANGTGGELILQDTNAASFNTRFYRVKAQPSN